jgi:hypothetical protein
MSDGEKLHQNHLNYRFGQPLQHRKAGQSLTIIYTMNKLYFFGLLFLLTVAACKKERACPPPYDEKACELIANADFPLLDISNDPDAWYEADIEGSISTMGTGYEDEGFAYSGAITTRFRASSPELPPGTSKIYDIFQMKFSLYKPTEKYVGQSLTLLEFYSPGFDVDTINNLMSLVNTLFSPGIKNIDDGTKIEGSGWLIGLTITHPIERPRQNGYGGTPMFTNSGYKEDPDNYFEITRSEAKDMGSFVRFTIWCNYKAELYNGLGGLREQPGWYFGQIRSGKAKLYADVNK